MGTRPAPPADYVPTVAGVKREVPDVRHTRLPWEAPVRDAGPNGEDFVLGGLTTTTPSGRRWFSAAIDSNSKLPWMPWRAVERRGTPRSDPNNVKARLPFSSAHEDAENVSEVSSKVYQEAGLQYGNLWITPKTSTRR